MIDTKFQPITYRRLSDIIEDSIKDLILNGKLKVGDKLPAEREISKQFGVSMVTVREALRVMETEGIIKKKRGATGGNFVARTDINNSHLPLYNSPAGKFSTRDVCELRKIIEPAMVRIAASRITADQLKALEENIRYRKQKLKKARLAFSEEAAFDIGERNIEFQRIIGKATNNPVLTIEGDFVQDLQLNLKRVDFTPDIAFSYQMLEDHIAILRDLKKGDSRAAEAKMLSHLNAVEAFLLSKEQNSNKIQETNENKVKNQK